MKARNCWPEMQQLRPVFAPIDCCSLLGQVVSSVINCCIERDAFCESSLQHDALTAAVGKQ
jgi:hypothetical protein